MNKGCALNQQKRDPKEKIDPNDQKASPQSIQLPQTNKLNLKPHNNKRINQNYGKNGF